MNTNRFLRWFIDKLFILLLAVYGLLFARWFLLSPIDDYSQDLGTFASGIDLLIFSAIVFILWRVFVQHKTLRLIFSTTTVLSLLLTGLYLLSFMPELEQMASYNGNTYILTYHREFLGNGEYRPLLAKWDNKFRHSVSSLGETFGTLQLTYDPLMNVVSVMQIEFDTQTLAYTDSNPPRSYEADTQLGIYRYYLSGECESNQNFFCQTYTYTVYSCTLENTGCVQLPFRYSGDTSDIAMSQDEQTQEVNIYFLIGDYPGVRTLIFTYGDDSQCHVAGCQLLTN